MYSLHLLHPSPKILKPIHSLHNLPLALYRYAQKFTLQRENSTFSYRKGVNFREYTQNNDFKL